MAALSVHVRGRKVRRSESGLLIRGLCDVDKSDQPTDADALRLVRIEAKVASALESLAWEMRTIELRNECRSIVWEMTARASLSRARAEGVEFEGTESFDRRTESVMTDSQNQTARPPHPADGMTVYVPVGDGAAMCIIDPRSFGNGGPEWVMRYGNAESIRFAVASLLSSYDYLLCDGITQGEATRRLRLMRAKIKECVRNAD